MQFTDHESTVAVAAVARDGFESLPKLVRRGAGATTWDGLSKAARYRLLAASADLLLPALAALPERPTVGAAPQFSSDEYATAAASALQARSDAKEPGAWDGLGEKKRRKAVAYGVGVLQVAIAAMPPRQDPEALVVPDHL